MIIFTSVLSHSNPVENKTMKRNTTVTATKHLNVSLNSLNSIQNNKISRKRQSKSLEKVRKRKRKTGSYYPIRDEEPESSTQPSDSVKKEKLKNKQNFTDS